MRWSCSHAVLLHRLAEPKASAMICNALYDILINRPLFGAQFRRDIATKDAADHCPAGTDEMIFSASHALKSSSDSTINDDPFAIP